MHVRYNLAEWMEQRRTLDGRRIGFVPTMGALHRGHASLVERCREENETVVVSIFVNPSQFNDPNDLDRYPRSIGQDLELLDRFGADEVIIPAASELYPDGYRFRLETDSSLQVMEGMYRPGFLQGMMTVVLKLLNLVGADNAYFGEKDYQQLKVVTEMARAFFLPTKIVPCPTVREESGLAMSSRNILLSPEARQKASHLFRALVANADPASTRASLEEQGFVVEYVEDRWERRLVAAILGGVRLIDNVPLATSK
jgi:pantoate--beta-alanine ligase